MVLAVAVLALLVPGGASAAAAPPSVDARSYLLIDAGDGAELAARSPDRQASIASATKLMTAYVALEELRLADELVTPRYDALPAESLLGLQEGERIAVRDLIYGLLLASGNDAAVTLAEGVSGSVPRFVAEMNRAAADLGLDDTGYANPIGLDEPGNFSTASDLAALTVALREDRFFRRVVDTPEITVTSGARPRHVVNRNNLVLEVPWVDGVKTGFTAEAGNVLVGSGTKKGVTLVSVVLGAPSESARDAATLALLDYGFSQYRRETVVERGAPAHTVAVVHEDEGLALDAARPVRLVVRRGQDVETEVTEAPAEVEGPLRRGQRLGTLEVTLDGERRATVPLVAARSVAEPGLLDRIGEGFPGGLSALAVLVGALLAVLIGVAWARTHRRHHQAVARRRRLGGSQEIQEP